MQIKSTWTITIATACDAVWRAVFLFRPTRGDLIDAISAELEVAWKAVDACTNWDVNDLDYHREHLQEILEVSRNVKRNFADTQVQTRVLVAGTIIGHSHVTQSKVYDR